MISNKAVLCWLITAATGFPAVGQGKKENTTVKVNIEKDTVINYKEPHKSVTDGTVTVEGKRIDYKAVAGTMVLKNDLDTPTLSMSYFAYFKRDEKSQADRPITFIYNGGPGSATVWLHMGAWGPVRVFINDTSRTHAPYRTINNDYSLLDVSDLVFIDAPGTGFGEVITPAKGGAGDRKDFFGIDQDARTFRDFITQFLSEYNRWDSPKYLFGESYGTFRSAALVDLLQNAGVGINGVILLSQLLTYGNMTDIAADNPGDDQAYELALPSYAATAWYHHKLPEQPQELEPFLKEVETFAMDEYSVALNKGAAIDAASYNGIVHQLHQYTGLPETYIRKANLRVSGPQFEQELLGDDNKVTGRLDSRFTGKDYDPLSETAEYDPMYSYIISAFTATFNNYVTSDLKFGKGLSYKNFGNVGPWDMKRSGFVGFPSVMKDLAHAMTYNPDLKVMLNMGYFDLGTPFYEGVYEMEHLPMPAALQKNIQFNYYYSGHMVYLHPESLKRLHDNVAKFITSSTGG